MNLVNRYLQSYLDYCTMQKRLDSKTIKAYSIDLHQFKSYVGVEEDITKNSLTSYIASLHQKFKPKTTRRKVASLKAFFSYLVYEEIIDQNPFLKLQIKFQEPKLLPRTIPQSLIQKMLVNAYVNMSNSKEGSYAKKASLRNVCILELLFATGVRISELCNMLPNDFDWDHYRIRIYGKGNRERIIQICNKQIVQLLKKYHLTFREQIEKTGYFFVNRINHRLSEQSVRFMIKKHAQKLHSPIHITPHMFRHTFATALLEEDVDIRYIQKMLGHSSITTTEIYTHVTSSKQNEILRTQHPRNKMNF